ncbi:MAG: adenylate/guanylate cyclase domain-containing protein [Spirochaetales bacterium]|nr:adenylate/guanylate cyclase domain-containing protein [Spirochaetales bacterium]
MDKKDEARRKVFQTRWFGFIIGFAIFLIFIWLSYGIGLIHNIERLFLDLNFNLRTDIILSQYRERTIQEGVTSSKPSEKASPDIILIGIDNLSLDEYGKWPFPRSIHANLINTFTRIKDQNKRERALFLDMNFIERDMKTPVNDVLLVESIKENGRVFLEAFFSSNVYTPDIARQNLERLKLFMDKFGTILYNQVQGDWKKLINWRSVECPLKPYINQVHGYGNVTFIQDPDQVFRRQPLVSRFTEEIAEIRLQDLSIDESLDLDNFEYLAWEDKLGRRYEIQYPLTGAIIGKVRVQMKAKAPPKEEDVDGDGKLDTTYIVRKYRDYLIPSITISLVLEYFHRSLSDIEVILGKHIRIPSPEKYNPETDTWEKVIDEYATYKYPKVFEIDDFENNILSKAAGDSRSLLSDGFIKNPLFNKYILADNLDKASLAKVGKALVSTGYQGITLIHKEKYMEEILIPIDENGRMLVNYAGKPSSTALGAHQTFQIRPYNRFTRDPGSDPENWSRNDRNANKIFIVGMFATGLGDEKPTPYGIMYGPEVNANAINTIIMDDFLINASWQVNILILFVIILFVSFLASRLPTLISLLISLSFLFIYFISCLIIFDVGNYIITISAPVIAGILTYISIVTYRVMTEEKDKKRIKSMFGKYVSPTVVDNLLEHPPELGGVDKELTVLFSDIRGFTTLSERMSPQALVNHLNTYLTVMTDILLEYRGTLDKYVGDEIMCFWGAPLPEPDHALLACKCALKQMEGLRKLNESWSEEKRFDIGIGINSGIMTVGNMGSQGRMNYTLMGDNVNLGARLEGTNKQYLTNIILSEYTYGLVKDQVIVRELDNIRVKGKNKPVLIYELVDMVDTYELSPEDKKAKK